MCTGVPTASVHPNDAVLWGKVGCSPRKGPRRVSLEQWVKKIKVGLGVLTAVPILCLALVVGRDLTFIWVQWFLFPFFFETYSQELFDSTSQLLKALWVHRRCQVADTFSRHILLITGKCLTLKEWMSAMVTSWGWCTSVMWCTSSSREESWRSKYNVEC